MTLGNHRFFNQFCTKVLILWQMVSRSRRHCFGGVELANSLLWHLEGWRVSSTRHWMSLLRLLFCVRRYLECDWGLRGCFGLMVVGLVDGSMGAILGLVVGILQRLVGIWVRLGAWDQFRLRKGLRIVNWACFGELGKHGRLWCFRGDKLFFGDGVVLVIGVNR